MEHLENLFKEIIDERPFLIIFPSQSLKSEASFIPNSTSPEVTGVNLKVKCFSTSSFKFLSFFGERTPTFKECVGH